MKETIGLICDHVNLRIMNELLNWAKQNIKHVTFIYLNKKLRAKSVLDNADIAIKALHAKKVTRVVAIDDYGIAAFMYISKFQDIVVAEISDEHSAHMTKEHNNANVLSFASKISTLTEMKSMLSAFCNSKYEGGRHKVRLDMMHSISKGGM